MRSSSFRPKKNKSTGVSSFFFGGDDLNTILLLRGARTRECGFFFFSVDMWALGLRLSPFRVGVAVAGAKNGQSKEEDSRVVDLFAALKPKTKKKKPLIVCFAPSSSFPPKKGTAKINTFFYFWSRAQCLGNRHAYVPSSPFLHPLRRTMAKKSVCVDS